MVFRSIDWDHADKNLIIVGTYCENKKLYWNYDVINLCILTLIRLCKDSSTIMSKVFEVFLLQALRKDTNSYQHLSQPIFNWKCFLFNWSATRIHEDDMLGNFSLLLVFRNVVHYVSVMRTRFQKAFWVVLYFFLWMFWLETKGIKSIR